MKKGAHHLQELLDRGYRQIIYAARDMVGEARMKAATNDVIIIAFCTEDGDEVKAKLVSTLREDAATIFSESCPEATETKRRLSEVLPPSEFLLIITRGDYEIYSMNVSMPQDSTLGVLN